MSYKVTIRLSKLHHKSRTYIAIGSDPPEFSESIVKGIVGIRWSMTYHTFYIRYTSYGLHYLFKFFNSKGYFVDYSQFKSPVKKTPENVKKLKPKQSMVAMHATLTAQHKTILKTYVGYLKSKRLSASTIRSYGYFALRFLHFHRHKTIKSIQKKDMDYFFEKVLATENFSISSHRQCVSALKYLVEHCNLPDLTSSELKRPKKSKKLPVVLSQEEVIDLIQVTKNLKHRAIIGLMYSCGLRIGELLNLELNALDFDRNQLNIKQGKGRKDRSVVMSEALRPLILNYLQTYNPKRLLFEGRNGNPYAAVSVRQFLKRSCQLARITKHVTPHVLRHSYATHLMENGVGLRHIQVLLGHAKPETTMIYTHVAKNDVLQIKSPLDTTVKHLKETQKERQKVLLSRKYTP